jgi:hypothetical protein
LDSEKSKEELVEFNKKMYLDLVWELRKVIGLFASMSLRKSETAYHIASISYLAGSEDADRFALANIVAFYAAKKLAAGKHRPSDDVSLENRLAILKFGVKSNQDYIDQGIDILKIIMLNDHMKDAKLDAAKGTYNPVNAGVFTADQKDALIAKASVSPVANAFVMQPTAASSGWN